ncbi:hypothetical protein [Paenibacillus mendelii]|uniref:Uncharacterized protein n=1 Tax=Paenibacillus mendelii TaxID=206163 RepID=A0ABV6J6Q3_9BACL|nr:hypothetical protein [Paenibacillus mendelii]MCQ6561105.1 hypothetical protein [Paenibacillus mendelii]
MRRKEFLFFILILVGLLLIANHHLGYSFGDDIFREIGIPPWTNTEYDSGIHISVIAGLIMLAVGYFGAVKHYQLRFPKIRSRIVLSGIVFVWLFPWVSENLMILFHYNSTTISSVAYSKKGSQCSYQSEEASVEADCSISLINYGKEKSVTVRPYLIRAATMIEFEPMTFTLPPHTRINMGTTFNGRQIDGTGFSGWSREIGIELEVDGKKKRYGAKT